ncbi:MAG: SusC/RagA family TonB-linked outer membrane protein, partial [Bacteroidales bacterium]
MKRTTNRSIKDLKWIISNKLIHFSIIVIVSLFGTFELASQTLTVKGNVVSEQDATPLPGVNIYEKGTLNGTVTGLEGEYSITLSSPDAVLVYSYIGFLTQEIPVEGQTTIDVYLKEDVLRLDEVVAIGYGKMKKSDLTGSVHSVKTSDIETGAFNSIEKQLSGKVPGVNITQISGQPGSGTTIRIRGTNSIMGNNEPLFVIDGVPYGNGIGADINPNDIESIEILKDASSTAIYGARGANGVILITTRGGYSGKTRVNFDAYYGINILDRKIDLLNAEELAEVHRRAVANGVTQAYDPDAITGAGTDWQDELYSPAPVQNYQLSLSGGNETTNYFISANYLDEEGVVHNSDYKRYSFRT